MAFQSRAAAVALSLALAAATMPAALLAWSTWPPASAPVGIHAGVDLVDPAPTGVLLARLPRRTEAGSTVRVDRRTVREIPADWPKASPDKARKRLFFRMLLPLVLAANERINADRARLQKIGANGGPQTLGARRWLDAIADRYRLPPGDLAGLLARVDVVPPSLALAQAAVESGWGRSRFARQANALFGQWTWSEAHGVTPKRQRRDLGNYGIRRFDTLYASVAHYALNLNRHAAYTKFRRQRARLRLAGRTVRGIDLVPFLANYSEHRQYERLLQSIIRDERLGRFDDARLAGW